MNLNLKDKINNKNIRYGGYSTLVSVIVIAIAIIVNVLFSGLDLHIDVTTEKFFSLSEQTEEVVKNLNESVTIYVLEETGAENPSFKEILTRYEKLSSKLALSYKDPLLYPQFTKKYTSDTTTSISNGSIIIENEVTGKFKILGQSDLYNMSYSSNELTVDSLAIEESVTSAINYVTSTTSSTIYATTGHMESSLCTSLTNAIDKSNLAYQEINLLTEDLGDPATSTLILYSPRTDLSDEELTKITNFLDVGGKAFIFADYDTPDLPNFNSLLAYYGVNHEVGVVVEGDNNHMLTSYPTYIIPSLISHETTDSLIANKSSILMPLASGLSISSEKRNDLTITPILASSEKAYLKFNLDAATLEKESGDLQGPIDLAYAIEDTNTLDSSNVITSRVIIVSDSYFLDDTKVNLTSTGNVSFFTNTLAWLQDEEISAYAISAKSRTDYTLPTITTTDLIIFGGLTIVVLPLIVVIIGIVVWLRRKNL